MSDQIANPTRDADGNIVPERNDNGIVLITDQKELERLWSAWQTPSMHVKKLPFATKGNLYYYRKMTPAEIKAEAAEADKIAEQAARITKRNDADQAKANKELLERFHRGEFSPERAAGATPALPGTKQAMLNTIYENQFDPSEFFKIKVDLNGKSVYEAGDADLTVNGRKLELFDGDKITVDKDGNITSYTHNGITYTKDTISASAEWHGLSLTAGANYVKVARAAMAAIVFETIDHLAPSR